MRAFVEGEKDFVEGNTIKAAVMTEPGKVEVQQFPWPKLERDALILKMHMSGIWGTDKHGYRGGRGADVVVEVVGTAEAVREGLEMTRRGGTYIETGNFVDTSEVNINARRHIAAKNVLIIGNSNHPHTGYYQHMEMMYKYRKEFPFEKLITHRFKLDDAQKAVETSLQDDSLKVVFDMTV